MELLEFTVNYPKGFHDPIVALSSGCRVDVPTFKDREQFPERYSKRTQIVLPSSTILTLKQLILIFNKIIKTYKLNPDRYLALNTISAIITNEESVVKNALTLLNGKQGRFVYVKNHDPSTIGSMIMTDYNPILKETKNHLLILFHRFLIHKEKNTEDIIMFEGQPLFIHLFALIIDSFRYPDSYVIGKKDCTDTFAMITLLEVLLKKKYKNTFNFYINNIPLPKVDVEIKIEVEVNTEVNAGECNVSEFEDDEWDKDDFVPLCIKQSIPAPSTLIQSPPLPSPPPPIIQASTTIIEPIIEPIIEDYKKTNDVLDTLSNSVPDEITEEIPDDWDSL
jgi:hypothetical protein